MSDIKIQKPPIRICPYPISLAPMLRRILTCGSLLLMLGSCSKDDPIQLTSTEQHPTENLSPIVFGTHSSSSSSPSTRAKVMDETSLKDGIGVYAYTTDDNYMPSEFEANFMYNQKVSNTNGAWEYTPLKYWNTTSKTTSFLAYAPYQPTSSSMLTYLESNATATNHPSLRYNLPMDVASQIDLVYGSAIDIPNIGAPKVTLNFEHALSRVAFSAKSNLTNDQLAQGMSIKVNKITVESIGDNPIYTSGTLALDTGEWSELTKGNATFELTQSNFNFTTLSSQKRLITNADSYLMLIPQRSLSRAAVSRAGGGSSTHNDNICGIDSDTCTMISFASGPPSAVKGNKGIGTYQLELNPSSTAGLNQPFESYGLINPSSQSLTQNNSSGYNTIQSNVNPLSSRAIAPVDWKILVESTIVYPDGTEYQNDVYAVCSEVVFIQGYGYDISLTIGVNSLWVDINEGGWNHIDQNEWFSPQVFQEEFHLRGVIPNMGRDDAVYTISSLYDSALDVELLKQPKTVGPGEFVLDENYVDIPGLTKKNQCYLYIENNYGQQWKIPFKLQYGFMQMTINIYADLTDQHKTYVLPLGRGQQPSTLVISWGDGTFSREINELTEENNFHVYDYKGKYYLRILTSQTNYQMPQITYIVNGVYDDNIDEIPPEAPYYDAPLGSYLRDMPKKIISLDTPILHYSQDVHSTFYGCGQLKDVDQNLFHFNQQMTDCSYCFKGCVSLKYAPKLWNKTQFTRHVETFNRCYPDNLSSIPAEWL